MVLSREEVNLLQDTLHRQTSTGLILIEAQKAIQFLQEAVWKDRVVTHQVLLTAVLLQRVVADHHIVADHRIVADHPQVPTHRDHLQDPHPVLHQAEVEVVELQEEDSFKLYRQFKTDHSKNRVQGQFYSKFYIL